MGRADRASVARDFEREGLQLRLSVPMAERREQIDP